MKKELRDAWADALESGAYSQTRGLLCRTRPGDFYGSVVPPGFCCLGVLSDIITLQPRLAATGEWTFDKIEGWRNLALVTFMAGNLPAEVMGAIGLNRRVCDHFAALNDGLGSAEGPKTFAEIAAEVRKLPVDDAEAP